MIVSADYVRVEEGKVVGTPGKLPDTWGRYIGMRTFSQQRLAQIGWFPVVYEAAPCSRALEFYFDEGRGRVVGRVAATALADLKKREAQRVRMASQEMMALGFPLETDEGIYIVLTGGMFWGLALAAMLVDEGAYLEVILVNDLGPISANNPELRFFGSAELRKIIKYGVDYLNRAHFAEVKEYLEKINSAQEYSDVADIDPFNSLGLVLGRFAYNPRFL